MGAALSVAILKNKIKNIVVEKIQPQNYFLKKRLLELKKHKKNNIPLLINFCHENRIIIKRLKQKYNLNKIINIKMKIPYLDLREKNSLYRKKKLLGRFNSILKHGKIINGPEVKSLRIKFQVT